MGPLTTPTKGLEAPSSDPWTPTSNLKMLISAASPEIRNREKERAVDSGESENSQVCKHLPLFVDLISVLLKMFWYMCVFHCRATQEPEQGEDVEKLQISRKDKSLGLLCYKFLARYPNYPNPAVNNGISLDDVASELSKLFNDQTKLLLSVVIDRYWFFITDTNTNYLYLYVPDNWYAEPIFIYCYKVNKYLSSHSWLYCLIHAQLHLYWERLTDYLTWLREFVSIS